MDIGDDLLLLEDGTNGNEPVNISDVLDAITIADPSFGGGAVELARAMPPASVEIVEQPAPRALRFRYECEGRSAGSIPGVSSTPENKTYPTIRINNYVGTVTIVVSCVNKDPPFTPHPHNLVGRDRCQRGVCTIKARITEEENEYQFKNLGIQCVKKKDIPEALTVRSNLRVDPFRTGFEHRNNPQSIDLNAVRLAFQVFLQEPPGARICQLRPVVSDIIYDKKAMCEPQIMRASHCSGPIRGGTQVVLLCEKVIREDIAVVFYQEDDSGRVVWEQPANTILVHKLVAIVFEVPPYANPNSTQHHTVLFQLKRPSDNARSNSLPFEYIPGNPHKPAPDLTFLASVLAGHHTTPPTHTPTPTPTQTPTPTPDTNNNKTDLVSSTTSDENIDIDSPDDATVDVNEKSLNELLDQVAELDEIYSENRTRLETVTISADDADDFDDAGTYTSLQLAFKNPVDIAEPVEPYEDVQVQTYRGPIIEFSPLKRDPDDDRAPPLPPKRTRKDGFKSSQTSVASVLKPGKQLPVTRDPSVRDTLTAARSEPALPPPKKRSFLSRLFRRKEKSPAPSVKSEGRKEPRAKPVGRSVSSVSGVRPSKFKSSVSHTSLKDTSGLSYADSVTHISLHGDENERTSQSSLRRVNVGDAPPTDGDTILVAESVLALDASSFKRLRDELELTDAEHYALYMALAPRATASEFDETSCYYSPVDANKFHEH